MQTNLLRGYEGWLNTWFGQLDSRSLSFFRIGIGLVLLKDALLRMPLSEVFYSDSGIVPRAVVGKLTTHLGSISLMQALGQAWMAAAFFVLWAVVVFCLLIGFRTRLMCVLNFILIVSVHARNPYLVTGADDMLRLLSFWMMFIPLNHHYSVDRYFGSRAGRHSANTAFAFPVRLLQLQVAISYLAAGLFKLSGVSWRSGTSVFYVLQLDSMLRPTGQWLAANSSVGLLTFLTYGVLVGELAFIVLVFAPFGQPFFRYLGLTLMGLMHLGIALTMTTPLVDFLLVFGVSYLVFLPRLRSTSPVFVSFPRSRCGLTFALGMIMGLVIWENISGLSGMSKSTVFLEGVEAAGLGQAWTLFSPEPLQNDAYIAVPGRFADDTRIDLRTGNPFEVVILSLPSGFDSYRWGGFQLQVIDNHPDALLDAWSRYYCNLYNGGGSNSALVTIQIRVVSRLIHAPGQKINPIRDDLLWIHACSSG